MSASYRIKPSLSEQWFITDALEEMALVCPMCRAQMKRRLSLFADSPEAALSEIYKQSRAIRVQHVMGNRLTAGRKTSDWAALETLLVIEQVIGFAAVGLAAQRLPSNSRRAD